MEYWVAKALGEILGQEVEESKIDQQLLALREQSLKMVTFLARFNRRFGFVPKVLDFIASPSLVTLKAELTHHER